MRKQEINKFDLETIQGLTGNIIHIDSYQYEFESTDTEVKKALKKSPAFRAELKRHGISWRLFKDYGFYIDHTPNGGPVFIGMAKYRNTYDYKICNLENGLLHSPLEKSYREKLIELKEKIESIRKPGGAQKYVAQIGRKYIEVCLNDGTFHKGNMYGGGWASRVGRYTADDCDLI